MDNLLRVGFIKEVKYPEWLANVVVVPKKGGKRRVCVDYTDLNKACPKDSFPLPRIDHIVDASTRHGILSSLDAFSRYHQIPMYTPDAKKTTFITPHRLYLSRPADPSPTRLADLSRSPGRETIYILSIYYTVLGLLLTYSFSELYLYL